MRVFILKMELTPHFMAGLSLPRVAKDRWPRIRKALLEERGPVCEICGFVAENAGLIDAHEIYEYPESSVVRLVRIQLLCKRCHDCKHLDHVERMGRLARVKLLIEHFCNVNQCALAGFRKHYDNAWDDKNRIQRLYGTVLGEEQINYGEYNERVIEALTCP
jgi:hypothetical protein